MINSHIHTFLSEDIPQKFLPLGLVRLLSKNKFFRPFAKILHNLNPFSKNDVFDKYLNFIETGKLGSQKKIFEQVAQFYPKDTKFCVLPMDMNYMNAGKVPRQYMQQLFELYNLSLENKNIIPFIHLDPRNKNCFENLNSCVDFWNFKGIKIYCNLGYFPYDEKLLQCFDYIQGKNIPVIAHCSPLNPVHYRGRKEEILKMLEKSNVKFDYAGKNAKELCQYFGHPKQWEYILERYPKINFCLAHCGSELMWERYLNNPKDTDNWAKIIWDMSEKYPNLFFDISYTMHNEKYWSLLKVILSNTVIRQKVLFGDDYYMVLVEGSITEFSIKLRAFLGENYWNTIAVLNPMRFLGID